MVIYLVRVTISYLFISFLSLSLSVFGPMHHKMKEMYGNLYRKEDDDDQYPSPPTSVSSIWSTIREYVSLAIETDMAFQNTKYCISTMMSSIAHDRISVIRPPPHETTMKFSSFSAALLESVPVGGEWCFKFSEGVHAARSLKDIALFVGVMDRYEEIMEARRKRIEELSVSTSSQVDGCNADVSLENKNDFAVGAVSSSTFGLLITPETSALYDSELPYMPNASFIPESKRVKLEGVPEIVVEKKKEE